jgi:hypothetical protein
MTTKFHIKDEDEFPMWGTVNNLYAGIDDGNEKKEVPFTLVESLKRDFTNNHWYVQGDLLRNNGIGKTENYTGKIPQHVCGFPMWKLQDLADKRNKFKTYYWGGWHTQE